MIGNSASSRAHFMQIFTSWNHSLTEPLAVTLAHHANSCAACRCGSGSPRGCRQIAKEVLYEQLHQLTQTTYKIKEVRRIWCFVSENRLHVVLARFLVRLTLL